MVKNRAKVILVSEGTKPKDTENLGFDMQTLLKKPYERLALCMDRELKNFQTRQIRLLRHGTNTSILFEPSLQLVLWLRANS